MLWNRTIYLTSELEALAKQKTRFEMEDEPKKTEVVNRDPIFGSSSLNVSFNHTSIQLNSRVFPKTISWFIYAADCGFSNMDLIN
jgi:hypothetical protein